jgi:hypothetical protein
MKKTTALVVTTLAAAIASQAAAETLVYKKADYSGSVDAEVVLLGAESGVVGSDDDGNLQNKVSLDFKHRYWSVGMSATTSDNQGGSADLSVSGWKYDDGTLVFGAKMDTIGNNASLDDATKSGQSDLVSIQYKGLVDGLTVAAEGKDWGTGGMSAVSAAYETTVAGATVKASGFHFTKTDDNTGTHVVASAETTVAGATVKGSVSGTTWDGADLDTNYFVWVDYPVAAIGGKVFAGSKSGETYKAGLEGKVSIVSFEANTWAPEDKKAGYWAKASASQAIDAITVSGEGTFKIADVASDADYADAEIDAKVEAAYAVSDVTKAGVVADKIVSGLVVNAYLTSTINDASVALNVDNIVGDADMSVKASASYSF